MRHNKLIVIISIDIIIYYYILNDEISVSFLSGQIYWTYYYVCPNEQKIIVNTSSYSNYIIKFY